LRVILSGAKNLPERETLRIAQGDGPNVQGDSGG